MDTEHLSLIQIILCIVLAFLNISNIRYFPNIKYSFGISELFASLNISNIRYFSQYSVMKNVYKKIDVTSVKRNLNI